MPAQMAAAALRRDCCLSLSPKTWAEPPEPPQPVVIVAGSLTVEDQSQKPAAKKANTTDIQLRMLTIAPQIL